MHQSMHCKIWLTIATFDGSVRVSFGLSFDSRIQAKGI